MLDSERIKFVIKAILDNAIRFSPADEVVAVTVSKANDQCLVMVADHGEGIEPSFIPHVFDEFANADVDYHAKGHGLSLAIARHIVQAHNGDIDVTSTKGSGTTVTVGLPALMD